MADNESDQEYEQIDLEMTNGHAGLRNKVWSPFLPPGIPGGSIGRAKANPYAGDSVLSAGVKKALSLDSDPRAGPPPLPPPNKYLPHQLTGSRSPGSNFKRMVRPPAPPPPVRTDSCPPAVPPKPGSRADDVTSPQRKRRISDDFLIETEELNPEQFLSKHRDVLPLQVRVSKGYYGNSDRTSVSEGDTFNIHFIKNTKVICMVDGGGGEFKIALNSGIEFGILFDPNDKRDEAVSGYVYEKVSDLLQVKVLPKVVRASVAWHGGGPESTVEKNELLILKGWKRKISSKSLKAYNPVTKQKKELPENCVGKFSTKSYDTRLFLSDIIDHVVHPLPCKAVLYMNADTCGEVDQLNALCSAVLRLKALTTETTLIATSAFVEDFDETQAIEIPVDLDIEFQVMRPKEEKETEDLYSTTRKLLENFANLKTSQYITTAATDDAYATQSALYSIVREGREWAGVDVVKPAAIYMNTSTIMSSRGSVPKSPTKATSSPKPRSSSNASATSSPKPPHFGSSVPQPHSSSSVPQTHSGSSTFSPDSAESIYDAFDENAEQFDSMLTRLDHVEKEMALLGQKLGSMGSTEDGTGTKVSREITAARADMKRMETRGVKAAEDSARAKADISEMKPVLEQLKQMCESLQMQISLFKENAGHAPSLPAQPGYMTLSSTASMGSAGEQALMEVNRKFLGGLNFNQVLNLLDSMGLSQHQNAFIAERVDGEILLECDDIVLQEELKITSKLQRVRLLKIIQGKHSAEMILCGEDPYAYVHPK